jgi:hypothetical protein
LDVSLETRCTDFFSWFYSACSKIVSKYVNEFFCGKSDVCYRDSFCAVEMDSGVVIFIPSCIKLGLGTQKMIEGIHKHRTMVIA